MAEKHPSKEFGRRRPAPSAPPSSREPVKRSGHVALLLMGTIAVGTTAYTLMPRQNCDPPAPGAPAQANAACSSGHTSSGGRWYARASFSSGDPASHSSSGNSSDGGSGGVSRGGFGAFAHAVGFSGGG
jgi:hypothetical protein